MITLAILRRLASARPAPIEHVPPKDFAVPSKTEKESNEASGVDKTVKEYQIFSGLSQYGPWGFLLIGVLICGVMLLICGLWGMLWTYNFFKYNMNSFSINIK